MHSIQSDDTKFLWWFANPSSKAIFYQFYCESSLSSISLQRKINKVAGCRRFWIIDELFGEESSPNRAFGGVAPRYLQDSYAHSLRTLAQIASIGRWFPNHYRVQDDFVKCNFSILRLSNPAESLVYPMRPDFSVNGVYGLRLLVKNLKVLRNYLSIKTVLSCVMSLWGLRSSKHVIDQMAVSSECLAHPRCNRRGERVSKLNFRRMLVEKIRQITDSHAEPMRDPAYAVWKRPGLADQVYSLQPAQSHDSALSILQCLESTERIASISHKL